MNHSFATQRVSVAPAHRAYQKSPTLNVTGLRVLTQEQRKSASGIAGFPEHAAAVIAFLAPHQHKPYFDIELRKILTKARKTVAFHTH